MPTSIIHFNIIIYAVITNNRKSVKSHRQTRSIVNASNIELESCVSGSAFIKSGTRLRILDSPQE